MILPTKAERPQRKKTLQWDFISVGETLSEIYSNFEKLIPHWKNNEGGG